MVIAVAINPSLGRHERWSSTQVVQQSIKRSSKASITQRKNRILKKWDRSQQEAQQPNWYRTHSRDKDAVNPSIGREQHGLRQQPNRPIQHRNQHPITRLQARYATNRQSTTRDERWIDAIIICKTDARSSLNGIQSIWSKAQNVGLCNKHPGCIKQWRKGVKFLSIYYTRA